MVPSYLDPPNVPKAARSDSAKRSWVVIGAAIVTSLVLLSGLVVGGVCLSVSRRQQMAVADVEREIARIKAAGDPITPEDMYAFHRVPRGVEDTTNLWLRACELYDKTRDEDCELLPIIGNESDESRLAPDAPDSLMPVAQRYLQRHADVFAALDDAAAAEGEARFPIPFEEGSLPKIPHVTKVRGLGRLRWFRSRVALAYGDSGQSVESLLTALEVGESLKHEPLIIPQLVRLAMFQTTCRELEFLIDSSAVTSEQLERLSNRISQIEFRSGLKRSMFGERAAGLLFYYQFARTEDPDHLPAVKQLQGAPFRPEDCAFYLGAMRQRVQAADLPAADCLTRWAVLSQGLEKLLDEQRALEETRHRMAHVSLAGLHGVAAGFVCAEADRDSALAGIAVRRYQLRHASDPTSLDDLVPDFLTEVPRDAFADGNPPLMFVRSGDTIAIYSVGEDKKDDRELLIDRKSEADVGYVLRRSTVPDSEQ